MGCMENASLTNYVSMHGAAMMLKINREMEPHDAEVNGGMELLCMESVRGH